MRTLFHAVLGTLFGVALSRIGFTSWDSVHRMFTFADFRLFLVFVLAVVTLTIAWPILARLLPNQPTLGPRRLHNGTLIGGALFGAGWALSGACPTAAMVQIGEGQLAAICTLVGIVLGNWGYSIVHERYFKWPTTSCLDD